MPERSFKEGDTQGRMRPRGFLMRAILPAAGFFLYKKCEEVMGNAQNFRLHGVPAWNL
jgi:hypothetical protein